MHKYYSKALAHPLGKRVFDFYTTTSKQIFDIHEEAKRIAEVQKPATAPATAPTPPVPETVATPEAAGAPVVEEKKEAPTVV